MKIIHVLIVLFAVFSCVQNNNRGYQTEITMLNLGKKFENKNLEISGLDWYGDTLFFLTQIPSAHNNTVLFCSREKIKQALANNDSLILNSINFIQDSVAEKIGEIPDYEAIAFKGDSVYMLIEAERPMRSFIIRGRIYHDTIKMEAHTLTEIFLPHDLYEIACEALIIYGDMIYVFYEANGKNIVSNPQVWCFDLSLNELQPVEFENVEYRITDASRVLQDNSFWIINHLWSGEAELLNPADEQLHPSTYNALEEGVNRLIQMEIKGNKIRIMDKYPLMLPSGAWNWEGLVSFDSRSFLIINDEFAELPNRTGLGLIKITRDE